MSQPSITFWVPLLIGAAVIPAGVWFADLPGATKAWALPAAMVVGIVMLAIGAVIAYRSRSSDGAPRGGRGGDASASGDRSSATGGAGGIAAHGKAGRGGNATVTGNNSTAVGGRGGNA